MKISRSIPSPWVSRRTGRGGASAYVSRIGGRVESVKSWGKNCDEKSMDFHCFHW